MKKVLLASTALVAFAGAATADVAITGSAEMGIYDNGNVDNATATSASGSGPQLFQDVDVTFTMSGETDGGVAFGASVDLDEAGGIAGSAEDDQGFAVFVSGGFGTVTLGNTDGALDWAMTEVTGPGTIADNETAHQGFRGSYLDGSYDGQIIRYEYSFGDFAFAVSAETTDGDVAVAAVAPSAPVTTDGTGYAVGLRYAIDLGSNSIDVGVGHQSIDVAGTAGDGDATGVSLSGTFGGLTAGVVYTKTDFTGASALDGNHVWVGASYTAGAFTVGANYGKFSSDLAGGAEPDGYAVTANYDLGGGAIIQAGFNSGNTGVAGAADVDTWSLGLRMNF